MPGSALYRLALRPQTGIRLVGLVAIFPGYLQPRVFEILAFNAGYLPESAGKRKSHGLTAIQWIQENLNAIPHAAPAWGAPNNQAAVLPFA